MRQSSATIKVAERPMAERPNDCHFNIPWRNFANCPETVEINNRGADDKREVGDIEGGDRWERHPGAERNCSQGERPNPYRLFRRSANRERAFSNSAIAVGFSSAVAFINAISAFSKAARRKSSSTLTSGDGSDLVILLLSGPGRSLQHAALRQIGFPDGSLSSGFEALGSRQSQPCRCADSRVFPESGQWIFRGSGTKPAAGTASGGGWGRRVGMRRPHAGVVPWPRSERAWRFRPSCKAAPI